jgi:hypothetical protein
MMTDATVQLLDLPDEILLIIIKELGSVDALYSFLNINKRLNQLTKSINNTKFLDFSTKILRAELYSSNRIKFNQFTNEILPQIYHNVVGLTMDFFSMNFILPLYEFPNLTQIVIDHSLSSIILHKLCPHNELAISYNHIIAVHLSILLVEPSVDRLFQEQITHITIKIREVFFSDTIFTFTCAKILAMCTKLSYLNINQPIEFNYGKLSLWIQNSDISYSYNYVDFRNKYFLIS